jgi:mannose/fructose/N-acetylgalactosamine-specific phosphotransferase system component IIC
MMANVALFPFRIVGYLLRMVFETVLKVAIAGAAILGAVFAAAWWINHG